MKGLAIPATALCVSLLCACSGDGGSGQAGGGGGPAATASITGTVPGTRIEAFADNGAYYATESQDNGTANHPFSLAVPAGLGLHLVMITGAGTPDEVVTPIGFRADDNRVYTRLMLGDCPQVELGDIPIPVGPNAAAARDSNGDGVLDSPFVLDDHGARNPLTQCDADNDGIDDWEDPDHGGYHYGPNVTDPMDRDRDGIPNAHDSSFQPGADDSDGDGLPDDFDANPQNIRDRNHRLPDDLNGDGYMDRDRNHDGMPDRGEPQPGRHAG